MNPTKSGPTSQKAVPASSNSVIWDGPDLICINLCKGDNITQVVYKTAMVVCDLKTQLDLTDLDLKDLFEICSACPEPVKSLKNILQLLIDKVYDINEIVNSLDTGNVTDEVVIRIASCFRTTGDEPIIDLNHSDYTKAIGLKVCEILLTLAGYTQSIESLNDDVSNLQQRVTVLEEFDSGITDLTDRVEVLESYKVAQIETLGENTDVAAIISEEVPATNNGVASLADDGFLWAGASENAAVSMQRMWKTIIDLRSAVKVIQDNCCKITCKDVIVDFDIKLSDDRSTVTLFFANKSSVPVGFVDGNVLGNKLIISDSDGAIAEFWIRVSEEVLNVEGIILDLSGTPINPNLDYFFNMDASMKSENLNCTKCITKTATYKDTCSYCEISVVGGSNVNAEVAIIYEL